MSNLLAVALVLQSAGPGANLAEVTRAELLRRQDSLTGVAAALAPETAPPSDTLEVDGITLILHPALRARFEEALVQVAGEWRRLFDTPPPAVTIENHSLRPGDDDSFFSSRFTAAVEVIGAGRLDRTPIRRRLAARRLLWEVLAPMLWVQADSALREWVPSVVPRTDLLDADDLAYQLATAAGPDTEACRQRRQGACQRALGLGEGADASGFTGGIRVAALAWALEQGGSGAWSRMLSRPGRPLADRLADTAGELMGESVADGWLDWLAGARGRTGLSDPVGWLIGGLWIALGAIVTIGTRRLR